MRNRKYPRRRKRKFSISRCILVVLILGVVIFFGIRLFGFLWGVLDSKFVAKNPQTNTVNTQEVKQEEQKTAKGLNRNIQQSPRGHDYSVLIAKGEHKVYLLDNDKKVETWPCAIGKGGLGQKHKSGDNMTPVGSFSIDEINDASYWTHDFGDGKGEIKNAYGPWFLSLDTKSVSHGKWDGIGIHGTHDPASVGSNASEGCIRLNNENLLKLKKYIKVGTKVTIQD